MSTTIAKTDVRNVIGLALTSMEFRTKLIENPETAIYDAGFSISDAELVSLKSAVKNLDCGSLEMGIRGSWW